MVPWKTTVVCPHFHICLSQSRTSDTNVQSMGLQSRTASIDYHTSVKRQPKFYAATDRECHQCVQDTNTTCLASQSHTKRHTDVSNITATLSYKTPVLASSLVCIHFCVIPATQVCVISSRAFTIHLPEQVCTEKPLSLKSSHHSPEVNPTQWRHIFMT